MENTSISREGEFVPRKSKDEFFRDGEVIETLFNWTDFLICMELNVPCHEFTLSVYNHAYYICWMIVERHTFVENIDSLITFENDLVRNHSWAVAKTLLSLNMKFYPIRLKIYQKITMMYSKDLYERHYSNSIKGKILSYPIGFRIPLNKLEQVEEIGFAQAKNYVMDTMNKAIKLQEEYKELLWQLQVEKTRREEAEQTIKKQQKKLEAWENDSFYKAVNIQTILKYVQEGDCDKKDVAAIKLMLLAMCANKVSDDVIEKIKTLKCGGNVTIYDIKKVENFNPAASKSETNHYHNKE